VTRSGCTVSLVGEPFVRDPGRAPNAVCEPRVAVAAAVWCLFEALRELRRTLDKAAPPPEAA